MNKKDLIQTLKFVLFSASAGIIQLGSFALFNDVIRMGWWPSYLISLILSYRLLFSNTPLIWIFSLIL